MILIYYVELFDEWQAIHIVCDKMDARVIFKLLAVDALSSTAKSASSCCYLLGGSHLLMSDCLMY